MILMSKLKLILLIVVVFLFGVFVGTSGSSSSTTRTSSTTEVETQQEQKPTSQQGKVDVKSQVKRFDGGYTKVVGEVVNNTNAPVTYVKVTATFYNLNKEVIATNFTYAGDTADTPLQPGSTAPFEVTSYPDTINADSYKLDVTWR